MLELQTLAFYADKISSQVRMSIQWPQEQKPQTTRAV